MDLQLCRDLYDDLLLQKNIPLLAQELSSAIGLGSKSHRDLLSEEEFFDYQKYIYLTSRLPFEKVDFGSIDKYTRFFRKIVEYHGDIQRHKSNDVFADIFQHIRSSKTEIPLLISGNAGSGKSTLLTILFHYLLEKFRDQELALLPVFIDLDVYNVYLNQQQLRENFRIDVAPIIKYIKSNGLKPIIIIDGLDDCLKSELDFNRDVLSHLRSAFDQKVIVGLSKSDSPYTQVQPKLIKAESVVELLEIQMPFDAQEFVDTFADIYRLDHLNFMTVKKVDEFVSGLKIEHLDFFLILLFCNSVTAVDPVSSVSDLFELHIRSKTDGTESTLLSCANAAFQSYVKKSHQTQFQENHFEHWRLIHSHGEIRDFLIAFHVVFSCAT